MRFRLSVVAISLFAVLPLFTADARADGRCLDRDCTMVTLFEGADVSASSTTGAPTAAKRYGTWGIDLAGMDRSVKPGDDFFRYVNGKWADTTQIPPDKTSFGAFMILRDLSEARVHAILEGWAADKNLKAGSDEAKVATIYRTFLDEATA